MDVSGWMHERIVSRLNYLKYFTPVELMLTGVGRNLPPVTQEGKVHPNPSRGGHDWYNLIRVSGVERILPLAYCVQRLGVP